MAPASNLYLYAITVPEAEPHLRNLRGVRGRGRNNTGASRISLLEVDGISMVVSPFQGRKVRPERRNISAHHAVQRALMNQGFPFLPAAFGMVAPSQGSLERLLEANRENVRREMDKLADKVEMGLKVRWDVPNIFEYFVYRFRELSHLRDRLLSSPGGVRHEDRIALGETFASIRKDVRAQDTETILEVLEPTVVAVHEDTPSSDDMVARLAFLVEADREKDFEKAVFEAAGHFDNDYAFDYNGPWPPYNFVEVSLTLPESEA